MSGDSNVFESFVNRCSGAFGKLREGGEGAVAIDQAGREYRASDTSE
jgi:hypothetical protein